MKSKIYLASPHMSGEGYEKEFVKEAFDSNWVAPLGPNVNNFELEIAKRIGVGHAAALVSGTLLFRIKSLKLLRVIMILVIVQYN